MTDNVYVYIVRLPDGIDEMISPCLDGYTIYLDDQLSNEGRLEAYNHALKHIQDNDFEKTDVQEIEAVAHAEPVPAKEFENDLLKKLREANKKSQKSVRRKLNKYQAFLKKIGAWDDPDWALKQWDYWSFKGGDLPR